MARRLAAALLGLIALALVVVFVARPALARKESAEARLTGALPDWRAPGGKLVLKGRAEPGRAVTLRVGGITKRAKAGARGRFRVTVRAPARAGRYPVTLDGRAAGKLRVRPLVLAAVGDVNLDHPHKPDHPWRDVAPVLRRADVAVANLESAVSTRGIAVAGKDYAFRGTPAALRAVGRAGIDAVSLANNHSLDYGRYAFLDTLRIAHDAGIAVVGGGLNLGYARRPAIFTAGGLRVALLAFSDVRPLGFDAGPALPGAVPAFPELMDPDIRAARKRADVVVVYFHWGEELATEPDDRQRRLAQLALDAGATVVLGAHAHVLQAVERPDSRRLVAWGLGNFVFPSFSPETKDTGILQVHLARNGVRGARLLPARIEGGRPALSD